MKFVVTGRAHPERADISFGRVEMTLQNGARVVASCDSSQFTISLDLPSADGWIAGQIVAEEIATLIVGALGFSLGYGYWAEVVQVTEENGAPHVLGVVPHSPAVQDTLHLEPQNEVFNRALGLACRNVFFRLAVRDYLQAMNDMTDCGTYCYRALEGIKCALVHKSGVDSWDEMHRALGTDKASIESIVKQYADPIRHGNWVAAKFTDKAIRWNMLKYTRDVLGKFLDIEQPAARTTRP